MTRQLITLLSLIIAGIGMFLLLLAMMIGFMRPSEITIIEAEQKTRNLPKLAFAQPQEAYNAIVQNGLLKLVYAPPTMRLPDLRLILSYFGPNGRPDVMQEQTALHFSMSDGKSQATIAPGNKLYLLYDRAQIPNRYTFSPDNVPTSLWIEAEPKGNEALVKVFLKGENGQLITNPPSHTDLKLQQKEYIRTTSSNNWEIGKWRVDGTLLGRQKARWYGMDKFLEKHGGEEYGELVNKQRIDFGEGDEIYSVYIGINDILVWNNDRWSTVKPGSESLGKPLLQVKKIDERLMNLDLWDIEGKNKIALTLLKTTEPWSPQKVEQDFKFIAARTRSQYIFEVQKHRMLLKPQDWLVLTDSGWKPLHTEQEIDDYVNRKVRGTLFVFDGIVKKDERQILMGTFYNPSRSDVQAVEVVIPQANVITVPSNGFAPSAPSSPSPHPMPLPTQVSSVPPHLSQLNNHKHPIQYNEKGVKLSE